MRWLVVAALCLACKGKQAPKRDDARVQPIDAAVTDAAVDAAPPDAPEMPTTITPQGVGPITVKHVDVDDYKKLLVGMTVKAERQEGEDFAFDEYIAKKGSTRILRAVVSDGSLFKVEVYDPMFATTAGVSVGMAVGDVAPKMRDLKCVFERYDPEDDAERVDRALRCESASLPHVMFDIDHADFKGAVGNVSPKTITSRRIVRIVWLAAQP